MLCFGFPSQKTDFVVKYKNRLMAEETCFQNGKPCCPSLPAYIWLLSFREGIQEFSSTRSGTKRMFLVICNHLSMSFYFWRVQVFVGWLHLLKPSECSSIVLEQVTLLLEGTGTPEGKGECKLKKKKKKNLLCQSVNEETDLLRCNLRAEHFSH